MVDRYGARPEAWDEWSALGVGKDLLPAVANPKAVVSPLSKMQSLGKTPSWYNGNRQAAGIAGWTKMSATPAQIELWKKEPDYSISVQCRGLLAVDIDATDPGEVQLVRDITTQMFGPCPVRYRENSVKILIPFKRSFPLTKHVIPLASGNVEVLADGQQFIAEGMHPSGAHYQWNSAPLAQVKELSAEEFKDWLERVSIFAVGDIRIAREKRDGDGSGSLGSTGAGSDEVAEWLLGNWETYDTGDKGQINILCPFAGEHSTVTGPTSTAYFPAGTGGYQQGHFVCMHSHCAGRPDGDFLLATGYAASEFADLPALIAGPDDPVEPEPLRLVRDKQERIEPTADNLLKLLSRPDQIKKQLAYDEFKDALVWAPHDQLPGHQQWREFTDADYLHIRIELERRGMKAMGKELLREAIFAAAIIFRMDTAKEWLARLQWDGIPRVEHFCSLGWGWQAGPYSTAVSRYVWTALAGRVIEPGCQADMTPILVGAQGAGKTTAIKAMAPRPETYVTIPLDDHDNDTSRRLRGKLVVELEELRGLNSRSIEMIKAWLTRTTEGWVPKFKEFEATFYRRAITFGTTNDDEFLNDPTGERRFLPGRCINKPDTAWIKEWCEQLWAEGAAMFMLDGVAWEEAQTLGAGEHHQYKVTDSWEQAVERWLLEPQVNEKAPIEGPVTVSDALSGAVNVPVAQQDRGRMMRMAKVLLGLGLTRKRVPVGDQRIWAYVKDEA